MIDYVWKINQLVITELENVVKSVSYSVTASENGLSTDIELSVELHPVTDPDKFIAYQDLSEAVVLAWVKSMTDMIQLEGQAQLSLAELRTPLIETKALPWG